MLITLPSSIRSIRRYICFSCLSSALIHYDAPTTHFSRHNRIRYYSSENTTSIQIRTVRAGRRRGSKLETKRKALDNGRARIARLKEKEKKKEVENVGEDGNHDDVEERDAETQKEKEYTSTGSRSRRRKAAQLKKEQTGEKQTGEISSTSKDMKFDDPSLVLQNLASCEGPEKSSQRSDLICRSSTAVLGSLLESGKLSKKETKLARNLNNVKTRRERKTGKTHRKKTTTTTVRRVNSKNEPGKSELQGMQPRRGMMSTGPPENINADDLRLVPLEKNKRPVPGLSYGLERVLFNPGVYNLRDPRSKVYNFDPYLESIMPVTEFDFNALKEYITSSRDKVLISAASEEKKKYTGSTSSMTAALAHFHYLLSQWRPIETSRLSQSLDCQLKTFSGIQRAPSAVFLRWRDGVYAIDADKEFDTGNILMMLGKSVEKLLTLPTKDFERYRKTSLDKISEEQRNEPESFHYTTMGDFLMRSQLDAYDSRLPGTGMFDLKTRAVVSVRMDAKNYVDGRDYEIRHRQGDYESYEREFYDMIRSAFLKYSLQVRMGRMDGIFVAFHNTQRIFGFQYISLPELDFTLHGTDDTYIGDSEFKLSVDLLNKILDRATAKFPEQSLRLYFETRPSSGKVPFMYIFAEPVTEEQIELIQEKNKKQIEKFERKILGLDDEEDTTEKSIEETSKNLKEETGDGPALVRASLDNQDHSMEDNLAAAIDADEAEEEDDDDDDVEDEEDAEDEPNEEDEEEIEELEETEESELKEEIKEDQTSEIEEAGKIDEDSGTRTDSSNTPLSEALGPKKSAETEHEAEKSLREYYDALASNFQEKNSQKSSAKENIYSKKENSPLLAMALTIRNRVNGEIVERPNKLTSEDNWTVDYYFAEVKNEVKARELYKRTQERRELFLGDDGGDQMYVQKLQELSRKGKEWRLQQDEIDKREGIRVYGVDDVVKKKSDGS